jgi:lysophospholipase L1-like esterase
VGQYPQIAVYDAEKTYLPVLSAMNPAVSGAGIRTSGTYTIPEGVAYFRIVDDSTLQGYFTYKQVQEDENATPWNSKVWHAFGTSITDTSYINGETGEPTGQYVPYLAEMSGLGVVNHGIAGGTLGKGGTHGGSANILSAILSADLSGADLITIEGFVNDYACAVDIGTVGDDGGTDSVENLSKITLCGALYRAIKHCLENSNATVILITDSTGREYTMKDGVSVDYRIAKKNSSDKVQNDYNQAIIDMGRYMGVRVIDAGGKSQIGQFCTEYLSDHLHHSALGGKQFATVIWDELKNISPRVKTL